MMPHQKENGSSTQHLNVENDCTSGGKSCVSLPKKLFLSGEQWSQEENCAEEETSYDLAHTVNGHSTTSCKESPTLMANGSSKPCFTQNNNLIEDKSNLGCSDDKFCFYHKFPLKVNNNIYPEESNLKKDGMEEYFQQNSSDLNINGSRNQLCNGSIPEEASYNSSKLSVAEDNENYKDMFNDQINALNGEEEDDDDRCIYTYKGDNYEANLSHLLETCFSCGLPTSERSGTPHGVVSIQRILNPASHLNSNQQGNLYSPEMDFLEMDFDPGSNGDGGDSECEDNSVLNIDDKPFGEGSVLDIIRRSENRTVKTSNIGGDMRNLMCRRCEMCIYNEQKVNNITSNYDQKVNTVSDTANTSYLGLNKELPSSHPELPKISHIHNKDLNLKLDVPQSNSSYANLLVNSNASYSMDMGNMSHSEDNIDKDNVENNLNLVEDFIEDFSDGGEEADDERDDSVSEQPLGDNAAARRSSSACYFCPPITQSNESTCRLSNNKTQAHINSWSDEQMKRPSVKFSSVLHGNTGVNHGKGSYSADLPTSSHTGMPCEEKVVNQSFKENNNLGSISAPEVSPTKEFSPLDKFSRSMSFHNQLSSPKYENVCSHPLKENIAGNFQPHCIASACYGSEYCGCKFQCNHRNSDQSSELSNLEACADRLNQRGKSVFNIGSCSVNSHDILRNSEQDSKLSNTSENVSPPSSPINIPSNLPITDTFPQAATMEKENSLSNNTSDLPVKIVQSKTDDPTKDRNTASGEESQVSPLCDAKPQIEKIMIWTEPQASYRQVTQVGTSACGATAVMNILLALDHARPVKSVTLAIKTRLRAENAPLVEYLLSRSNAGATHEDLIRGVQELSENAVTSRFFHMYPKRSFQLARWLSHWIKKGGVPVATLNLQVGVYPRQTVPDAWHHQMVFGVGPLGVYLTNPLECVSDSLLSEQLCSDSVLLVRRFDIVSRWDKNDKLIKLSLHSDPRWNEMNVLGQVVGVLKEQSSPEMFQGRRHLTSHVAIPASYQSGITIFMRSDNPFRETLENAPELPFLDE